MAAATARGARVAAGRAPLHFLALHRAGRAHARAPDSSAELIELGEPEAIGAVDEDRVGVRYVEPRLDDGRADEDVRLAS